MFKQILFLNWMGTRRGLLPFLVAAFALPILAVQGITVDPAIPESATIRASQLLYTLQFWTPVFPAFAFAVGTVLALMVWNWDHRGEHVYALTLPMARSQYVAMKMGAGVLLLLLPVVLFWVSCLLATSLTEIPEGLRAYPNAIAFRFFLATLIAYAVFFALAAGTMRTAIILLTALVAILVLGELIPPFLGELIQFQALGEFSLLDWLLNASLEWPGPFEVYSGNWMLLDV
jgi:hypothetical protein